VDLGHLLAVLRRQWVVLLVAVTAGLAIGIVRYASEPPSYQTSTTVFFSLNRSQTVGELSQGTTYLQSLTESYADVASSRLVLNPVIEQLGLSESASRLGRRVTARPRTDTAILDITVADSSAQQAARIADGVATQLRSAVASLSPRTNANAALVTVTIISPAAVPASPSSPRLPPNLLAGLLGGLVLGLAVIAVREIVLAPVATREAAAEVTSAPVLSLVGRAGSRQRPLPTVQDPRSAQSEAYSMLRTNLQLQVPGNRAMQIVVTSASPGEGRTTTAVNLAIAVAQAAHRVLLIDADLRRPAVATVLGLRETEGLSTLLAGRTTVDQAMVRWEPENDDTARITVLPAGPVPPNPSDLLASEAMDKLLDMARHRFDVVILDSSPLLQATDAAALAARTRGALIVVDDRRSRRARLSEAVTRLGLAGAEAVGVVLNRADRGKIGRYTPPARTSASR
jgi:polysaccharide biosynthesis transport protein